SRADLAELRVVTNYADTQTGARYIKFVQTVNGITVESAVINPTILPDGSIVYVGNRALPDLARNANSAAPTLNQREAIAAAADALGLSYSDATVTQLSMSNGAEREAH